MALVLVVFRMMLPFVLKAYVNRQLDRLDGYVGRVERIDVDLWRGAYSVLGIKILKRGGHVPQPLFEAPVIDLSIEWSGLLHGSMVGEIEMEQPVLNFVSASTEQQSQSGRETRWHEALNSLFPVRLNRFTVIQGSFHFLNPHSSPPVDLHVTELNVLATNLGNIAANSRLPTGIIARGRALGDGRLEAELHLDLLASAPTYELTAALTNVDLVALNGFLRAYGKFDVERGRFSAFTSVASKEGAYEGYVKVFFEDLDVFEWKKERGKNALQVFWQGIVGVLGSAFKNQTEDRLATRIPLAGFYRETDVGVAPAIVSLLRNAFVRALVPKLDEEVKVEEVDITDGDVSKTHSK